MSVTFNADEIYEMAEEIERKGMEFYTQAAQKAKDQKIKNLLVSMANMEEGHLKAFQQMRQSLSEKEKQQNIFDPDNEASLYLQSMADSHGWEGKKDIDVQFTGDEPPQEVIKAALNAEKNSVVFYVGIRDMVPEKSGKDKVEQIIKEELSHIAILNKQLAALR